MSDEQLRSEQSAGPLERYRRRAADLDAAVGKATGGSNYVADVIRAAEALINGDKLIIFPAGAKDEAFNLAISELRHRLSSSS